MNLSDFKKLFIGGTELKQLSINGAQVWKSGYTNQVPISIGTDGKIYNGIGYKDGYRVRSGGAETSYTGSMITGYIPVRAGDVIHCTGWNFTSNQGGPGNAVNYSGETFNNLGQFTLQPAYYGICNSSNCVVSVENGIYSFTVPNDANIRYLRFTAWIYDQTMPVEIIVTVNESID